MSKLEKELKKSLDENAKTVYSFEVKDEKLKVKSELDVALFEFFLRGKSIEKIKKVLGRKRVTKKNVKSKKIFNNAETRFLNKLAI